MKLATFRMPDQRLDEPGATFAAAITETDTDDSGVEYATQAVMLEGIVDVGTYLTLPLNTDKNAFTARSKMHSTIRVALMFPNSPTTPSSRILRRCLYRLELPQSHLETGQLPEYPTVFAKYGQTLTGPYSNIELPALDHRLDYEGELAVIISAPGKNIPASNARNYIAGYAVSNDFSLRGMQGRTDEWTQGKIFEATTPVGPWLVTPDEFKENARLTTLVNGEIRQDDSVDDLVFKVDELVEYLSQIITLLPGDIILTGTPGGVALAMRDENGRRPWLKAGDVVETRIEGLGAHRNVIV